MIEPRRDTVLLVGDDRVRSILTYLCWPRVLHAVSRDEATRLLDEHAESIECIVVSEDVPWAKDLRGLLVGERATIRFIRVPHYNRP